jgi:transitional endoplasmic reticulum ATPase
MPLSQDIKLDDYIEKIRIHGWTGADIEAVCRTAGLNAIKRVYKEKVKDKEKQEVKVTKDDFDKALEEVSKSIHKDIFVEKKEEVKKEEKK